MRIIYIVLFFILGTIMGSFYNVVAYRLSNDKSLLNPKRSFCPNCYHKLKAFDLIPIFSYVILKGKCRYCHEKISVFYPIIELFTGCLFAVSFYSFSFSYDLLISISLSSLFVIVIFSDLNYYIIPDQINLTFPIVMFIINIFKYGFLGSLKYLGYGFIMFLVMYLIMLLGNFLFKQESLGGGDIKLLFGLGMIMPILLSFVGIVLGTILAFPIALFLLLKDKDKIIPFGPFLVAAFLILFLLKIDVSDIYQIFSIM